MKTDKKVVGIIFYHDIGMNRYLVKNSAICWAREGYSIDIFVPDTNDSFLGEYNFNSKVNIYKFRHKGLKILRFVWYLVWVFNLSRKSNYKAIIGIGTMGLIISYIISKIKNIPVIYHCLELEFSMKESVFLEKVFRYIEKNFVKNILMIIIPGENWVDVYSKNNNVPREKFVVVPNSQVVMQNGELVRVNYFKEKLGISPDKKIIIYTGAIEKWYFLENIIKSIQYWSEKHVFVIHGWSKSRYVDKLKKMAEEYKDKIFFSAAFFDDKSYDKLILSADISVALYPDENNGFFIGLSSGKIFQYLKCGLPVICNSSSDLLSLIQKNNCGICINPNICSEITSAIKTILADYDKYSQNARRCFEKYEFSKFYNNVIEKLKSQ